MRILYLITQGECGGAQKHILDIALDMRNAGHKVYVATGRQESLADTWLFNNLKQNGFEAQDLFIIKNLQREINPKRDISAFAALYRLTKTLQPHIVHVHSTKAGILGSVASKLAKSRVVYTVHGFVFSEPLSLLKKIFYIVAEFLASFFRDQTIVVSKFDFIQGNKYNILRKKKGVLIYNGLDEKLSDLMLDKESAKSRILQKIKVSDRQTPIIGVVANLYRTKGIKYLIEAAEIIRFHNKLMPYFVVIGEGELREELEKEIKDRGLQESFFLIGSIPDAYLLLRAFDLIVLPSVKEGMPYILLEATLAGVPSIGARVGGIVELSKLIPISLTDSADSAALEKIISSKLFQLQRPKEVLGKPKLPEKLTLAYMLNALRAEYERVLGVSIANPIPQSFLLTLPALNEEKIIGETLLKVHEYLTHKFNDLIRTNRLRCCVAINGTTDGTESAVMRTMSLIPYLSYTVTKEPGRGGALLNTWKGAREDVLMYIDSDLAYQLDDIGSMIASHLSGENYDLVVASRRIPGSFVLRHPLRKILTEGYNRLVKILFQNSFTDAQAGCKSIKTKVFQALSPMLSSHTGWFFDTAMLLYAEKNNAKIKDIRVTYIDNRKWRLKIVGTIMYFLKNLFFLRVKTLLRGY